MHMLSGVCQTSMFHYSVITAATLGTGGKRAGWVTAEARGGEGEAAPPPFLRAQQKPQTNTVAV